MNEKCPIEPDKAIRYDYGDGEDDYLLIAPSHDSIQMFPDSKYNHLRYYDASDGIMRMAWLPGEVLADLYDEGIPHTKRNSISQCEYEGYITFIGRVAIEVEPFEDNLDAEWRYYSQDPDFGV